MRTTVSTSLDPDNTRCTIQNAIDDSTVLEDFDASTLPFELPADLYPDVKRIKDPNVCYYHLQAQRDRRLRLLIRRYVNQIQYGCRNINCTTPTCFSYRKRNSKVPLRKYTDVSARTIACRLVEDFGEHGRDVSAGLCPNEPVVPWYEDPNTASAKWNKLGDRTSHKSKVESQPWSHPELPSRHGVHHHNNHIQISPRTSHSPAKVHTSSPQKESPGQRSPALPAQDAPTIDHPFTNTSDSPAENPDVAAVGAEANDQDTNPTQAQKSGSGKKKDYASFTQMLFDLVPLRRLGRLGRPRGCPKTKPIVQNTEEPQPQVDEPKVNSESSEAVSPPVTDQALPAADKVIAVENECHRSTNLCGITLQRLTWGSVFWMGNRPVITTQGRTPFEQFIRQSVAYNLSDGENLLDSVRQWHDSKSEFIPDCYANPERTRIKHTGTEDETSGGKVPQTGETSQILTALDCQTMMRAFANINRVVPQPEMMRLLHLAVQQCFIPPRQVEASISRRHLREPRAHATVSAPSHTLGQQQLVQRFRDGLGSENEVRAGFPGQAAKVFRQHEISLILSTALLATISTVFTFCRGTSFFRHRQPWIIIAEARKYDIDFSQQLLSDATDELINLKDSDVSKLSKILENCQSWPVQQLVQSVMLCIAHCTAVVQMRKALDSGSGKRSESKDMVRLMTTAMVRPEDSDHNRNSVARALIELIRTVLLFQWDGKAVIQRTSHVGGALLLLAGIYQQRQKFCLEAKNFLMPFLGATLDEMEMPVEWMEFRPDEKRMHLLAFSFLFEPSILVRYFRAINVDMMRKSHEEASVMTADAKQFLSGMYIPVYGGKEVLAEMRPYMNKYFVLTVRRDNVLDDAISQLWRRQRREIMRPLRVRLGKDEGEDGLDHGGVQQEFFRLLFAEAFKPEYGMFTVDDKTRMTWFQPGSLEPLYRYEALGMLMSLAVYNAVTLPLTMPLAFYRKLLGMKVKKIEHIADGWPVLAKGLQTLLDWSEGDVGDVIARTYEFSYEFAGQSVNVDMSKGWGTIAWAAKKSTFQSSRKGKEKAKSTSFEIPPPHELTPPTRSSTPISLGLPTRVSTISTDLAGVDTPVSIMSETSSEAPLVTNDNRQQYVSDYISWLADKSIRARYDAFESGFFTCLDRTALSIFTAESLKSVVEGHTEIDIDELEQTTTYDDYSRETPIIKDFWNIVRNFSPEQHRKLLEFVTASDRVPVNGLSSITFIIQRNGEDDTRLPSSSTCYGRLLLPLYSSKEVLKEKLEKAIENSMGFGVL